MATVKEHNGFIFKVFSDQKHFRHVLTQDDIVRMTGVEKRYPISKLPVCSHCERLAMWGINGIAVCTKCGTTTLKPITLAEYYIKGYDLDITTHDDRDQVKHEKIAREFLLPDKLKI